MREIKFRAKTVTENNWIYGTPVFYPSGLVSMFVEYESFDIQPKTLGQFTGLIDKNGKDIYKGDIINCIEMDEILGDTIHKNCIVIFDKCAFFYCPNMNTKQPHQILYWASDVEVIGNIYETKLP